MGLGEDFRDLIRIKKVTKRDGKGKRNDELINETKEKGHWLFGDTEY